MRKATEEEPRVTTWEVNRLSSLETEGSSNKKLRASKNVLRQLDGPVICVSVLSPKEKKLHSTVTQIKSVIQVLDLIIGRFQRWRLGSNGDRLGTASTLGRGKVTERKDRGRKGATFPNDSFSFPDIPAIHHTSSSSTSSFLL